MKMLKFMLIFVSSMHVFAVPPALVSGVKLLRRCKKELPSMIPCSEQLQNIFEESDARYSFLTLAEDYLADTSPGKRSIREISVFQALSGNDVARTRDVFRTQINVVAELWLMKYANRKTAPGEACDTNKQNYLLHRYLTTELFEERRLPFEILHPRVTETVPLPLFYFGKTLRSIYEDAIHHERVAFEEKKLELVSRIEQAESSLEKLPIQKEYLKTIQEYSSSQAHFIRVIQTAEQIAGYASRLIEAGERIDTARSSLTKEIFS